jgi:hypothetical protein
MKVSVGVRVGVRVLDGIGVLVTVEAGLGMVVKYIVSDGVDLAVVGLDIEGLVIEHADMKMTMTARNTK